MIFNDVIASRAATKQSQVTLQYETLAPYAHLPDLLGKSRAVRFATPRWPQRGGASEQIGSAGVATSASPALRAGASVGFLAMT